MQLNWKCNRKREKINKYNINNKFKEEEIQKPVRISKFYIMNFRYINFFILDVESVLIVKDQI